MNIPQWQHEMGEWAVKNFGNDPRDYGLILSEETGEVTRAILKRKQETRGTYEEWSAELRKEAAEVFIALAALAYVDGFDLEQEIYERWRVIQQRDWKADKIGHGMPNQYVIEIPEEDLDISYFHSPHQPVHEGPKGVQLIHKPSGMKFRVFKNQSQLENTATALRMLRKELG